MVKVRFFKVGHGCVVSDDIATYELSRPDHINKPMYKWIVDEIKHIYCGGDEWLVPINLRGFDYYSHYCAKVYCNDILSLKVLYNPATLETFVANYPSKENRCY